MMIDGDGAAHVGRPSGADQSAEVPEPGAPQPVGSPRSGSPTHYERIIAEMAELAGGLAHELRNPLSTMMINLKLLAEDLRDSEAPAETVRRRSLLRVETLRQEAERLQGLFDEFLRLTGPCRLHRQPTDVPSLIRRLVNFFEPLAHNHKVELVVQCPSETITVYLDEEQIGQALLNLMINAVEAMPQGGTMSIRLEVDSLDRSATAGERGVIRMSVGDTGVGIAAADRDKIMRPFFSTKRTGTGLGLSLTRRIVEEHGGTLDFESTEGRGTRFVISLPA